MTESTSLHQHLASPCFCCSITISTIGLMLLAAVPSAFGQETLLDRQLGDGYQYVGQIHPRHARDIVASNWSVGAETMDRDYTIYKNWKEYLGPLGAKKARIQSGWAKTEKKQGEYDWAWVDEIVLDMVQQGVEPWVCLCYGNPIYPGGGDTGLGGGLVASGGALQAWERYVAASVQRYSKYVDEWELWNEPRTGRGKGTIQYGQFVIRTAEVIRKLQPQAEIMFAAGGSFDTQFAEEVLEHLQQQDKLDLVNTIIYHPYSYNPDSRQGAALELRRIAKSFAAHIDIRQGENGAPSIPGGFGAISENDWTEQSQAKWATRRLLGDLGLDIPSSYFSICDMAYPTRVNYKGLLAINDDKTVHHKKLAYHAVQHVTALFDNTLTRIHDLEFQLSSNREDAKHVVFGYRTANDGTMVTLWRSSDTPGKQPEIERVDLTISGCQFESPVWVDLLTGRVYALDQKQWSSTEHATTFRGLAVYDSVVVLAERSVVAHVLAEAAKHAPVPARTLPSTMKIACTVSLPGVQRALADLSSDWQKVLGTAPEIVDGPEADLLVRLDHSLERPESYRIDVSEQQIQITGADERGLIYGIYRVSQQFLGVDPYWYFKDLEPEPRESITIPLGSILSKDRTFRYRGWFVNDEDLLTEWKEGGGERFIRYPFYAQVVRAEVIDRICEALLRAGGNLIIPASFVDVMNQPEANLIRLAAERGLYVTQHHIEPLGVSHFGFENYWKAKGKNYSFAYGSNPEQVREVWRAFAGRWYELAGDKVVWQLGLRGKGDQAIWSSDESVSRAEAGQMISRAIVEQWKIVRSIDPRPLPPTTTTLWLEGSQLMSEGSLTFPKDITIVFCDEGESQKMQQDFHQTPRSDELRYGAYYHIGFWASGPHLLQGSVPRRIRQEFSQIVGQLDTDYAIINVCNVREHVLGIQVATELMNDFTSWSEEGFWWRFAPEILHQPYRVLLGSLLPLNSERIMQDGALFRAAKKMLASYCQGRLNHGVLGADTAATRQRQLTEAIATLDRLIASYPADPLTSTQRAFHDVHLLTQARMWRELDAFYLAVIQATDDPQQLAEAEAALERFLQVRQAAEGGKWANWYRGDKKVNVPALLKQTREARQKLQNTSTGKDIFGSSDSRLVTHSSALWTLGFIWRANTTR